MKMKTQLGDYKLIQYQILQIKIISIIFIAGSRDWITNEILGVKWLKYWHSGEKCVIWLDQPMIIFY